MKYRVYLPNDGEPHHETLRDIMFGECEEPTFVRVDGDLVVYDFEVQDSIFEHWLEEFDVVIGWEKL